MIDMPEPHSYLLQQARNGQAEALVELLEPYETMIFRLAYRVTGHSQDAEDLAQEAMVRLVRSLKTWRGDCRFRTWVYRVTLNVCLTAKRKRPSTPEDVDSLALADAGPGPEELALQSEFHRRAREEIQRLPSAFREAVALRLSEDMSYAEIAEVLDIPLNTALTRVHRGMKHLRERLRPWMKEERP